MNEEYIRKDINTSDIVEGTVVDVNNQVVSTDPVAERVLVNEPIADETGAHPSIPDPASIDRSLPREASIAAQDGPSVALINLEESDGFRTRWLDIQGKFVDEPRAAVQQADALVSEVIEQLTRMFANEHTLLEGQWKQGKEVSTEDLRQALLRYHSFFKRLVV